MAGYSTVEEVPPSQYQVFINFRGEELRDGFVSHLVYALKRRQISAFYDGDEDKGEPLERLLKRIEESRIALAILSINYNESVWCLRELAKMKECMGKAKLLTIPIFYKVSTSTVEDMSEQLDKAITRLKGKKKEWKEALKKYCNENKKVQKIAEGVYKMLKKIQLEGIQKASLDPSENSDTRTFLEGSQEASVDPSENIETRIPSRRDAKTIADFFDRTFTNSPMEGKVEPRNIQVFINFHGYQLRNSFVVYLVDALHRSGIDVFIDSQEQRGEDLYTLFNRIEDSGIAIVVFSSRYTESKRCLDELVKIRELVDQGRLKVLPIFYKVTPYNVKRLKGEIGDHFRDKEYKYWSDEPKIKRWKEAIAFFSHQFGLTFYENSNESDFVATIVNAVLEILQVTSTVESGQSSH